MKKTITKKGFLTATVIAAVLMAFSFTVQANSVITDDLIQTENFIAPDGDKTFEGKCGEAKTSEAKSSETKSGAVSSDTKVKSSEGKCGEGKCGME